jgi:NADPH:quinone reductase
MRKIVFQREQAEAFVITEAPDPVPGPGQMLVRTEAVGVGVGLVRMLRAAASPEREPGGEVVGRIIALGPGVEGYVVGDRVGGVVLEGAFSQSVLALPGLVSTVPGELEASVALTLVRGGLIALSALHAGRFEPGESVLVTGGASGVGHLAVQLAKARGARRVVAAVGSRDKAEFLRDCGADEVVTYAQPSWGERPDLILDGVGGELVQRGVDALAPYGRLVAFSAGGGNVDASSLIGSLKTVTGFSIGLISRQDPGLIEQRRAELWKMLAAGQLRPAHKAFPMERVADAVELIETRRNLGRVLLRTN